MKLRPAVWALPLILLALTACGMALSARESEPLATPLPAGSLQLSPADCPITQPQEPVFVPPEPFAPTAPYGQFWYGTNGLWTVLQPDGRWAALPQDEHGYGQKVFWWSDGYDLAKEPQPNITVSGRRLDGDAPVFEQTGATNGYHGDMGQFMLTGITLPSAGCWEITGRHGEAELSFVVRVEP